MFFLKTQWCRILPAVFAVTYGFDPTDDRSVSNLHQGRAVCCGYGPWAREDDLSVDLQRSKVMKVKCGSVLCLTYVQSRGPELWQLPPIRATVFFLVRGKHDMSGKQDIVTHSLRNHGVNVGSYSDFPSLTRKLLWYSRGSAVLEENKFTMKAGRDEETLVYRLKLHFSG